MAKIRIGRSSSNEVVLKHKTVSRSHAEVEDIGGGLYRLTDVGSSAGTYLRKDGKWTRITSVEVGPDAVVCFGEAEVTLSDIVSGDPAKVASHAAGRSRKGAAAEGASRSGGGWSGRSAKAKVGIIAGGCAFVLLIAVGVALAFGLAGGEVETTAGGGSAVGGGTTTGGGTTGGGAAKPRRRANTQRRAVTQRRAAAQRKRAAKARKRAAQARKRAAQARKRAARDRKRQQASLGSTRIAARFAGRSIGFQRNARDYAIIFSKGGAVKGTFGEYYGGDTSTTQYFSDAGNWSVRGERLCVKWRAWDRGRTVCYAVSGNSLSGGGVLSGRFRYR